MKGADIVEAIMMAVSALLEMALMMLVLVATGVVGIAGYVLISGIVAAIVDDYRKRRKARQERG